MDTIFFSGVSTPLSRIDQRATVFRAVVVYTCILQVQSLVLSGGALLVNDTHVFWRGGQSVKSELLVAIIILDRVVLT